MLGLEQGQLIYLSFQTHQAHSIYGEQLSLVFQGFSYNVGGVHCI